MIRRVIKIDESKCTGCGLCVNACHEGAIGLKNGKAVLLRDDYCDGLGDCLPSCPTEAISFESKVPNSDNATVGDFVADKFKTEDYSITFLDLQVALDSLPYIERKMFEMTYIDLLSQKEVIDTLGLNCSQSYVSRQLVKIKNKLANKMSVSCN